MKVPKDLLVAHAEKRVLQAALEQEAKNAADAKVHWEGVNMPCFVPSVGGELVVEYELNALNIYKCSLPENGLRVC